MRPRVCDVDKHIEQAYIGQRLARTPKDELYMVHRSPRMQVRAAAAYKKVLIDRRDLFLFSDNVFLLEL